MVPPSSFPELSGRVCFCGGWLLRRGVCEGRGQCGRALAEVLPFPVVSSHPFPLSLAPS